MRKIHASTYQQILCDRYGNGNSANALPTGDLLSGLVSIQYKYAVLPTGNLFSGLVSM